MPKNSNRYASIAFLLSLSIACVRDRSSLDGKWIVDATLQLGVLPKDFQPELIETLKAGRPKQTLSVKGHDLVLNENNFRIVSETETRVTAKLVSLNLDPAAVGRSFGGFVRRNQNQEKSAIRSLSLAVRGFGDGFFAKLEEDERKARRQAIEEARKAHQDSFTEAFNQYESSLLITYRLEFPELVEKFEEKSRQRLVRMKDMSPKFVEQMKARHEDPAENAKMFAEFLRDEKKSEVLDFWKWDELHNSTPFRI